MFVSVLHCFSSLFLPLPPPSLYLQSRVSIMKAATRKSPIAPVRSCLSIVGCFGLHHDAVYYITLVMLCMHTIP